MARGLKLIGGAVLIWMGLINWVPFLSLGGIFSSPFNYFVALMVSVIIMISTKSTGISEQVPLYRRKGVIVLLTILVLIITLLQQAQDILMRLGLEMIVIGQSMSHLMLIIIGTIMMIIFIGREKHPQLVPAIQQ